LRNKIYWTPEVKLEVLTHFREEWPGSKGPNFDVKDDDDQQLVGEEPFLRS
jgi:hypothetical protein